MKHKTVFYIVITIILIVSTILFLRVFFDGFTFWSGDKIRYDVTGQIGDFIGGVIGTIIAAAGFYFLYLTFTAQRKSYEKERIESKFYELVKIQRENVSELKFDATNLNEDEDSLFIEKTIYEGKSVFKVIFNQFVICRNELREFFRKERMLLPEYETFLRNTPFVKRTKIDIKKLAIIDICYNIVFYGLSSEGLLILQNYFKTRYKPKFTNDILRFLSLKPASDINILEKWKIVAHRDTRGKRNEIVEDIYLWRKTKRIHPDCSFKSVLEGYHNRYIKYYGGHQFRLGHYFRHLYQTVKFINYQSGLSYLEKYENIKVLRAQLSTYEQAVLFLNSLSKMGESWELDPEVDKNCKGFKYYDFELITKYNLIKNLPGEAIYGIKFKEFYPLIEYESDGQMKKRPDYK